MGIKHVREGNQCERCKKDVSKVGKLGFHEEYDLLCCENCLKETIKEKNLPCSKCKRVVGLEGLTEHRGKQLCSQCLNDVEINEAVTEERKRFFKTNWFKWIMISFGIIALALAYIGLNQLNT